MKRTALYLFLTAAFGLPASALSAGDQEPQRVKVNYARPLEPPARPAFLPLPPGQVEPRGWIRDWCLAARDGMSGHLDELDPSGDCKGAYQRWWTPDKAVLPEMAVRDPEGLLPLPDR